MGSKWNKFEHGGGGRARAGAGCGGSLYGEVQ